MSNIRLGALGRSWSGSAYNGPDHAHKRTFHNTALRRLRKLADLIGLAPGTYEVRSNKGGIAVSGEITLHAENLYVQVGTCLGKPDVLIRTCKGRKDYSGGRNRFVPGWDCLDPHDSYRRMTQSVGCIEALASYCQAVIKEGA